MRNASNLKLLLVLLAMSLLASPAFAAPCLPILGDPAVGDAAFSANVSDFTGLPLSLTIGNGTGGTVCLENSLWTDPSGFVLGSYVKGADGLGGGPTLSEVLNWNGATLGSFAANANGLDFYWVQDTGNGMTFPDGSTGGRPSQGIIWDLGGPANQAAVFVYVDHGPVPGEVLENTAWLSNDPNALDAGWTQAFLTHVYGYGWSGDPDADGFPDIADGMVAVYRLPDPLATFRYVSVTHGGPGAILRDGDNEIDAVGGLTAGGGGVGTVPEPATMTLLGGGLLGLVGVYRKKFKKS